MEYKDYYSVLGLARGATEDEIKRSYRKLARKYHPDVSKEPQAEERFKEVQEAYEVLKDSKKRAAYDQLGSNWKSGQDFKPPPGWQPFGGFEDLFGGGGGQAAAEEEGNFSDFFSMLFGHQMGGGGGGFKQRGPRSQQPFGQQASRSQDQRAKIKISLEEAYQGGSKTLQLQVPIQDGHGRVQYGQRTLKVNIPKGVTSGQQLRLAGQGAGGGNLYLELELEAHPRFKLEGQDIYFTLALAPWEAALGTKVAVPTLGGTVEVKVAAGSQGGQKLRLKGRGLSNKERTGDQYVLLEIHTPPATNASERALYEQMSREFSFDPRKA